MSYKFSFADNTTYSAADINSITKRLVSSGIEDDFQDGVAHNVSKFNETGKLLYTSGVVPDRCMTLKVEGSENGKIIINPGVAFFNDGATIEIGEGGETLSFVEGVKNYVYLKNELADTNRCYPYCGVEEPTGDYVLLAEIYEDGTIADKRTYAKGKLMYQGVGGQVLYLNEEVSIEIKGETSTSVSGHISFDIGPNNFEYVLYTKFEKPGSNVSMSYNRVYICQLSDGAKMGGWQRHQYGNKDYSTFSYDTFIAYEDRNRSTELRFYTIDLSKEGILNISYAFSSTVGYFEPGTVKIPLQLIFF